MNSLLNQMVVTWDNAALQFYTVSIFEALAIFAGLATIDIGLALAKNRLRGDGGGLLDIVVGRSLFLGWGFTLVAGYQLFVAKIPKYFLDTAQQVVGAGFYLNPGAIQEDGFALAIDFMKANTFIPWLTVMTFPFRLVGFFVILAAFVLIAAKVARALLEAKLLLGGGVLIMAFAGSRVTYPLAEGLLRYLFHLGIRLFLYMMLLGFAGSLTSQLDVLMSNPLFAFNAGSWLNALATPVAFAYLVWTGPDAIASYITARPLNVGTE